MSSVFACQSIPGASDVPLDARGDRPSRAGTCCSTLEREDHGYVAESKPYYRSGATDTRRAPAMSVSASPRSPSAHGSPSFGPCLGVGWRRRPDVPLRLARYRRARSGFTVKVEAPSGCEPENGDFADSVRRDRARIDPATPRRSHQDRSPRCRPARRAPSDRCADRDFHSDGAGRGGPRPAAVS